MNKKVLCLIITVLLTLGTAACKDAGKTDNPVNTMKYAEEELGAIPEMTQPGFMRIDSKKQLVVQNAPVIPMGPSDGGEGAQDQTEPGK